MPDFDLRRVPLLAPFMAFVGGLIAVQSGCSFWFVFGLVAAGCIVLSFSRHRMAGVLCLMMSAGMFAGLVNQPSPWPDHLGDVSVRCVATVHDVKEGEGSRQVRVVIDSVAACGFGDPVRVSDVTASITIPSLFPVMHAGARVVFCGKLAPVKACTDLPDELDYAASLRRSGVQAFGLVQPDSVTVTGYSGSVLWRLRGIRDRAVRLLLMSDLSESAGAFLSNVLVGDASAMPMAMRERFSGAGLAHVLALSGLHVGIIAIIALWMFWPLTLLRLHRFRYVCVMIVLWLYAMITGMAPSVTRAVIMLSVFMFGRILERRSDSINSLCLSGLIILACDSQALASAGFQMSFVAVAFILVAVRLLEPVRERMGYLCYKIVEFVTVSLAAVAGTGIIAAYYFHTFPVYFILANAGVLLLMPWIVGGGVLLLLVLSLGLDVPFLCAVLNKCVDYVCAVAEYVSGLPGAVLDGCYFSAWVMVPYFVAVCLFWLWLYSRRVVWLFASLAVIMSIGALQVVMRPVYPPAELFVTRERFHTNVLIRADDTMMLFTTALPHARADVKAVCEAKYADYMGRRGVDCLMEVTDTLAGGFSINGCMICFYGYSICVADGPGVPSVDSVKCDYVLVCRGYKECVVDLAERCHADTVLLSNDINLIRHNRYTSELEAAGIPCRSLRSGAFYLSAAGLDSSSVGNN